MLDIQKDFIKKYLSKFYARCKDNGIEVLAFFGNDDVYTRKSYFRKVAPLLDEAPFYKNGYEFKAYPFVTDYKFGLKTACKWDSKNWRCSEDYINTPVDFTDQGQTYVIFNPEEYFESKGTIEDDLKNITVSFKTIIAIHQPPANLDLDTCRPILQNNKHWVWASDKIRKVGSQAVYDWVKKQQPLLVLCGHIHENYYATKTWKNKIGNTLIIQPGQCFRIENKTRCVFVHIYNNKVDAALLEISNK